MDIRAEFEAWVETQSESMECIYELFLSKDERGNYVDGITQTAFMAFKAGQASRQEGEPIGFLQSSGVSQLSGGHPAKLYPLVLLRHRLSLARSYTPTLPAPRLNACSLECLKIVMLPQAG